MNKFQLLFLLFSVFTFKSISASMNNDTINIYDEISNLKTENHVLKDKLETLNQINDKILNSVYFTIGAILTIFIGLSLWNNFSSKKLNDEKFKEHLNNAKKELITHINETIEMKISSKSFKDLSAINLSINNLKNNFTDFEQDYIIKNFKYHPYNNLENDYQKLFKLYEIITSNKKTLSYEPLLEATKKYLEDDGFLHFSDKPRLIEFLDKYFNEPKYKFPVEQIKKLIENKED